MSDDYYLVTLEDHLNAGMGRASLRPEVRKLVIKLLQEDAKEKLALLEQAMKGRGHTYGRDKSNGKYFFSMTMTNRLLHRLRKEAGVQP